MSVLLHLLLNCNAFDFRMVWDRWGVLSTDVYFYQYLMALYLRSLLACLVISETGHTYLLLQNSHKPQQCHLVFDILCQLLYIQ